MMTMSSIRNNNKSNFGSRITYLWSRATRILFFIGKVLVKYGLVPPESINAKTTKQRRTTLNTMSVSSRQPTFLSLDYADPELLHYFDNSVSQVFPAVSHNTNQLIFELKHENQQLKKKLAEQDRMIQSLMATVTRQLTECDDSGPTVTTTTSHSMEVEVKIETDSNRSTSSERVQYNNTNNVWVWHGEEQEKLVPIRNSHKKKQRPYDNMVMKLTNIK
jgi:hypothetical protein